MRLRHEVRAGIGVLMVLQLLTSLAAIALLTRMSPAVDRILQENVASEAAVEAMLAVLASPEPDTPERRAAFLDALARARGNVTEPEEDPLVAQVGARWEDAVEGEADARAEVVLALQELGRVNRASMEQDDLYARRLGSAGAWAAVILGVVGFAVAQVAYRRLRERLEVPIVEVDRTLGAVRLGDPHRRCVQLRGPVETRRILENLNWLLDRETRLAAGRGPGEGVRDALLHVLDREEAPVLVVRPGRGIVASNRAAMALWEAEESPTEALLRALREGVAPPAGWQVEEAGRVLLCRFVGEES